MKSVLATTLGLLPLITASAAYGQTVLPVPLVPQLQSDWCWAASGQMIFNYLGATRVRQCDEVNSAVGRTDCCGTVACSSDADCTPPGATYCGDSEDPCIPSSAPLCNSSADCNTLTESCASTTFAKAAGYAGQCSSVLCRSKYCTPSSCAGTCTPATCDQGGSTHFSVWDFNTATPTTCSNPISFSTLESEINANRPVEFSWYYGCSNPGSSNCTMECGNSTATGAGHVLVAIGYYVDPELGQMVYVNDPFSDTPLKGSQYWLTYAEWLNNPSGATIGTPEPCPTGDHCSGVHFAQSQVYGIHDDKFCSPDNDGLATSSFEHCWDYQYWRGRSPVTVNFMNNGTVASSFQNVPTEPVQWEASLSSWQSEVASLGSGTTHQISGSGTRASSSFAQCSGLTTGTVGAISAGSGLRPSSVSVMMSGTTPYFTSIWTPSEGAFQSQCGLSSSQLASTDTSLYQQGYVMADVYPYTVSSTPYFCATWVQKSGQYEVCTGQTLAEYDSAFATLSKTMIPVRVAAYDTPSGQLYASLWQPASTGWYEYLNMSPATYQSNYTTVEGEGFRLSSISSLDGDYSALWTYPQQSGCSSAAAGTQVFAPGVFGCAGKVTFDARNSLCAANCQACSAGQFSAAYASSPNNAPAYDYWTNEYLGYSGSSSSCAATDNGTGNNCGSETPMRVCVSGTTTDPLGNVCNWYGCGLNSDTQYPTFGGCGGDTTAGTVCCCE